MKNQQRVIVGLVLALILIIFAVLNGQTVAVNFFGARLEWPLIVVIAVSVIIGALITFLVSTASGAKERKQLKTLREENKSLTNDMNKQIAQATKKANAQIENLQAQLADAKAASTHDTSKVNQ